MIEFESPAQFQEGMIIPVNKPLQWTSFDVVNKIRVLCKYRLGIKKIKVGHAGTLDPLAEGLLIICTGRATKKISELQDLYKTYEGVMVLGKTTPSYDLETEPQGDFPIQHINQDLIHQVKKNFIGKIKQKPPVFSAKKKDGQRLYEYARAGKEVGISEKTVEIKKFEILQIAMPEIHFEVHCSKGTYIRSLSHDFGSALGSGAYLKSLIRTGIGNFQLKNAYQLSDIEEKINQLKE